MSWILSQTVKRYWKLIIFKKQKTEMLWCSTPTKGDCDAVLWAWWCITHDSRKERNYHAYSGELQFGPCHPATAGNSSATGAGIRSISQPCMHWNPPTVVQHATKTQSNTAVCEASQRFTAAANQLRTQEIQLPQVSPLSQTTPQQMQPISTLQPTLPYILPPAQPLSIIAPAPALAQPHTSMPHHH